MLKNEEPGNLALISDQAESISAFTYEAEKH